MKRAQENGSTNSHTIVAMIEYIHTHIQQPEFLKLSTLSIYFNFSTNHLSNLFKRQINVPVKQYIDDYKFKVIQNQLNSGSIAKKEIP
ncbi:hypothetical protein [Pedobacter steynii]|uniref:HTH araC/xylS-type domain-containing protein n=1 Tax=Pedobacter steynii TaxID=430522 RepID=A0A1D7QFM2_9SPHI|nr:hypothetical protein [Pedobacter steynii]AOM77447.1 hypothetical protein BFS30_09855 [Pedobacter steynii]